MRAVWASSFDRDTPLAGLRVGERPAPEPRDGWAVVDVRAASLNRHDLWTLQGAGLTEDDLPMILGCDAAGVDEDGRAVIVHALIGDPDWRGDETMDPTRSLLSERHQGTFADQVMVPRRNLIPKPDSMSFAQAACLPTAWLTAYRMLFVRSGLVPGQTVLVQGAGGGVASAAIRLGSAAGLRVWATSRTEAKRELALRLGAERAFPSGERLPEPVDAVVETVGEATWLHSLRSLRPGGTIVVAGATTGFDPPASLARVFFLQNRVIGSTMGTLQELEQLVQMCGAAGIEAPIDRVLPLERAEEGLAAMLDGDVSGKIVLQIGE